MVINAQLVNRLTFEKQVKLLLWLTEKERSVVKFGLHKKLRIVKFEKFIQLDAFSFKDMSPRLVYLQIKQKVNFHTSKNREMVDTLSSENDYNEDLSKIPSNSLIKIPRFEWLTEKLKKDYYWKQH